MNDRHRHMVADLRSLNLGIGDEAAEEIERLAEVLGMIAEQQMLDEIEEVDDDGRPEGDFETAYDIIVGAARQVMR